MTRKKPVGSMRRSTLCSIKIRPRGVPSASMAARTSGLVWRKWMRTMPNWTIRWLCCVRSRILRA